MIPELGPATDFYAFDYDRDWVANGQQLALLSIYNVKFYSEAEPIMSIRLKESK